jgi:2,4-dienoyl-CoA reductase-like NADH-dependent reductase (Old Yellow Enzyme family)
VAFRPANLLHPDPPGQPSLLPSTSAYVVCISGFTFYFSSAMNPKYQPLFQPYVFANGTKVPNRLVMAPMTNFGSHPDGVVSDQEIAYYIRRAKGVGMVITACTYVSANGKGFHGEFGADSDQLIPSLQRLATAIKGQGAKAVLQIFHGGRLCPPVLVPEGDIVSASAVAAEAQNNTAERPVPRPLREEEIEAIIRDFGEATRRAIAAGFDGVEIHGANGYLVQQFFSPHSNQREDRWGGNIEKRMTFPLAVVEAVQQAVARHASSAFIAGYRFSPEEPETPGITMADTLVLIDALAERGLDYLHVSLKDYDSKPRRGLDDSRSRLEIIQERVGNRVPVIGVGSIYTPEDALQAFATGVPLLALGRGLIMEPDWVEKVKQGHEANIQTRLNPTAQQHLVVPDYLWQVILTTPGWFPGIE